MFSRNPLDWGLLVVYFGFLVFVWARGRRAADAPDYLVAGRRLTLPAFVATLVATWYGGILGIGEYTWRYGVSNWLATASSRCTPWWLRVCTQASACANGSSNASASTQASRRLDRGGCSLLRSRVRLNMAG